MSTQSGYEVNDTVRLWGTFKAASWVVTDGVPAATYTLTDPTTVTLTIKTPGGVSTAYTYAGGGVTKDSTGVFYRDVVFSEAGTWYAEWAGTGAAAGVQTVRFRVVARQAA